MRPYIEALDVDAMEWTPLGPAGLYSKLLSRDQDGGARTALQRLVPADNYEPPKVAHYHHTYEEIIGIAGCFSFDSVTWIKPGSYVFHPPKTVHGFKSGIREESLFLSRVGRDLEFNFVPEPKQTEFYVIEGEEPPARGPFANPDSLAEDGWEASRFLGAPARIKRLSIDPDTHEGSAVVRLPAGWAAQVADLPHYVEMFVMEGGIAAGDRPGVRHGYFFYPPQSRSSQLRTDVDSIVYVNFGGNIGI